MLSQLEYSSQLKRKLEGIGDTTSEIYRGILDRVKRLEAEIGTYDGKGLDYDDGCMDIPKYIYDAVKTDDIKSVMDWLGSPVDKKRLDAREPDHLNATLLHLSLATDPVNSDLLSILLQYGADVNALDANGVNSLSMIITEDGLEQAKILLEWGVEISLPRSFSHLKEKIGISSNRGAFSEITKAYLPKLGNLVSSEFGGRRCEVINLPNHPQLNGKTCVVEKYIAKKDKYKIIFEGSGNAALVGPNNLKRRDRTPLDCGYYISFENGRVSRREFATKEECQAYVSVTETHYVY